MSFIESVGSNLRAKLPRSIELEVFDNFKIPRTFAGLRDQEIKTPGVVFQLFQRVAKILENFGKSWTIWITTNSRNVESWILETKFRLFAAGWKSSPCLQPCYALISLGRLCVTLTRLLTKFRQFPVVLSSDVGWLLRFLLAPTI